jgi:hypothetical protein
MNSRKEFFEIEIRNIQPSQLYISKKKLTEVKKTFNPKDVSTLKVIPIKKLKHSTFYTDGHTRAFAAYQAGYEKIPVIWEDEELDWEMYEICIQWCKDAGIYSIADLNTQVVKQKDYEILWYKRCNKLHKELAKKRTTKKDSRKF